MSNHNPPYAFLLVVKQTEDAAKIDEAIHRGKLGCQKVGDKVYLGFFFDRPSKIYLDWKLQIGIVGEIHWIPLPGFEVTK